MLNKIFSIVLLLFYSALAQYASPRAVMSSLNHDFGTIVQGVSVTHNFVIKNLGGEVLQIQSVKASCGCTAVSPSKRELSAGDSTVIKVDFNSAGRKGKQTKYINVVTNDPANPSIRLTITCNIIEPSEKNKQSALPKIQLDTTEFDFGKVSEGKIYEHTFSIKNAGSGTLEIKDIKTSCGCTAALISSKKINAGKTGTLKIELDTANRSGKLSRTVVIKSNDPVEPEKILTIHADITGGAN
jgi:hypothetical protein